MDRRHIYSLLFCVLLPFVAPTVVMADAVGSWKLYPCYNNVTDIQPAGDNIYVLASGNLYSYNNHDTSIQEYNETTGLSDNGITNIAWVQGAKSLLIVYSDYYIDLLSEDGDVVCIADYADKTMTGEKTVNDIYVTGQYAYISTGFGIIKLDVKNQCIVDTYNLGFKVNYCYINGGNVYAASESEGIMCSSLTSNLLDKNNWEYVGDYTPKVKDKYVYDSHSSCYWAADSDSKLTKYNKQADGSFVAVSTGVKPDGPASPYCWRLYMHDGKLFSTAGNFSANMNSYLMDLPGEVDYFEDNKWQQLKMPSGYKCANVMEFDKNDSNHFWVGGLCGLLEYNGYADTPTQYLPGKSTTLNPLYNDPVNFMNQSVITSMTVDASNNLWLLNGWSDPAIQCYSNEGKWTAYPHVSELSFDALTSVDNQRLFISPTNGKMWWVHHNYNHPGILCYDYTMDQLTKFSSFTNQDGTRLTVYYTKGISEDGNGNIWIGTDIGPLVLKKSDILESNPTFEQPKVNRNDGTNLADYLLNDIPCNIVRFDKLGRKWFATSNGLYLISADNQTQIEHFTVENSPICSNMVYDILLDDETGVVYIATENGLCSYQSDVTSENENMSKETVWAYPNPVTPEYTGMITICGLASGTQLKITTSSGQLVHSGTCSGGSYRWNGCDTQGRKVASGIYMVNISTSIGEKACVTKIAIVR